MFKLVILSLIVVGQLSIVLFSHWLIMVIDLSLSLYYDNDIGHAIQLFPIRENTRSPFSSKRKRFPIINITNGMIGGAKFCIFSFYLLTFIDIYCELPYS